MYTNNSRCLVGDIPVRVFIEGVQEIAPMGVGFIQRAIKNGAFPPPLADANNKRLVFEKSDIHEYIQKKAAESGLTAAPEDKAVPMAEFQNILKKRKSPHSLAYIYGQIKKNLMPPLFKISNRSFFLESDLKDWLKNQA